MMEAGRVVRSGGLLVVLALMASGVSQAQEAGTAREKSLQRATEVEEITVTAQKREERLQEAPISVTALTSSMIDQKGINTVLDIQEFTPNVNLHNNAGGNSGLTVGIRGAITTDSGIGLEPAVGVYVDGVYVAKSTGSQFDMGDLDRIEVLRGPQGTLYGRNTIGGTINLITKRPADELSATIRTATGNYDLFRNITTLNVPIVGPNGCGELDTFGKLNGRVTTSYRRRDGYFENTGEGSEQFDDLNRFAMRGALRWEPRENMSLDYDFDYHRSREEPTAFQLTAIRPGSFAPALFPDLPSHVTLNREKSVESNFIYNPDGTLRSQKNELEVRGHTLTGAVDLGEVGPVGNLTVKSISGYRNLDELEVHDTDGSPLHVADFGLRQHHKQSSEELQLLGVTPEGRINYVVGFYYFDEKGGEDNQQIFYNRQAVFLSASEFHNWSYAPFGQATWTPPIINDKLSFTGGLRYTYEKREITRDFHSCRGTAPECSFGKVDFTEPAEKSFDNLSPMGNVALKVTDEVMTYGRVSRGFKSGGFNFRATTAEAFREPFKEETLTAYEIGVKSQWFDNRLRLNTAGFFNDYEDLQVTVFQAGAATGAETTIENAASAEVWGAEVEAMAVPFPGVDVRLSYGLLLPSYKEFCEATDPATGVCTAEVSDERDFVSAPEHSITAGIGYTAPAANLGTFSVSFDAYYQDHVFFLVKENDLMDQSEYVLFNARMQLADIPVQYGSLDLALWGRNLSDKKYRDFGLDFGSQLGVVGNYYGDPRTFGVELVYRWAQES